MNWIDPGLEPSDVVLVTPHGSHTAKELQAEARVLRRVAPGAEQTIVCKDARTLIVALEAWQGRARRVVLLPPDAAEPVSGGLAEDAKDFGATEPDTRWILLTSGTTGTPKPIGHTKRSLTRTVRTTGRTAGMVWGLVYQPSRMAGLQVVAQALGSGCRLVAPDTTQPLVDQVRFLADNRVTALSATPTLWRQILQIPASDDLRLDQVTMGGEIADQRVLDALATRFPDARITHVFAATESGAAFAVTDRRAGFPAAYLNRSPYGIRLAVIDGVLAVHAPDVEGADVDGFVSTGDLVEVKGDRVHFQGRQSGVVNIGGAKVMPERVEELLRRHECVLDARVYARSNSFSGSILMAEVVATPGVGGDLSVELRSWVRSHAPSHYVPARVVLVDRLETSVAGKALRT